MMFCGSSARLNTDCCPSFQSNCKRPVLVSQSIRVVMRIGSAAAGRWEMVQILALSR
jgi:hypothetical protein